MSELGAYYVDKALGWNRKPPTAGRVISSRMVNYFSGFIRIWTIIYLPNIIQLYGEDDTWFGFMQRVLPDYNVEVALIAWFDGIKVRPPTNDQLEIMLHNKNATTNREKKNCGQISDILVFDFLIDGSNPFASQNSTVN